MKTFLKFLKIFLLMSGVFAAETDEGKTVMEGDSVTLNPDLTQIQGFIQILWRFGDPSPVIAQLDENEISYTSDERFRGRLQLNQTGSLIIKNMRTKHSGLYKLEIDRRTGTSYKTFSVTVYESPSIIAGAEAERQLMSVMEGDSVTLHVPQLHGDELILWRSGDEGKLIAKHDIEAKSSPLYDSDERFRDRLQLDQTGSLIITNTRTTDSGLYTVKISSNKQTLYKRFTLTVSVPGVSPAAVAGIVVAVLLVSAAAGVMYFCRPRTINLSSQTWSVPAGDDVTLNPETEIQTGDEIQWLFGAEDTLIAQIRRKIREMITYLGPDEIFIYRLKLDKTTGSLTIESIDTKHAGLYTLKIRRGRETLYKRFIVFIEEEIAKLEGESVTLNPATEINDDDVMRWMFRHEEQQTLIAEIKEKTGEFWIYDYVPDGRFRGRLELDTTTGSLTIKNTRTSHSGVYKLEIISSSQISENKFIVTVNDKVEKKSLNEGDSVTLNPDTEIKRDDLILWMFGDQDKLIAQIRGGTPEICDDGADERFKDRLKLNKTGSLTITDIRAEHTGLYKLLTISSSRGILFKKFKVLIHLKDVSVTEGEPVALYTGLTERQTDDKIQWRFGDKNSLIAEIKGGTVKTYDGPDERFRDRLELNKTTGDLTIRISTAEHAGRYKLKICSSKGNTSRTFIVTIRGAAVTNEAREKSEMKEKNDSTGKRVNESATVEMPLLNGEDVDEVNEEEGTSSL